MKKEQRRNIVTRLWSDGRFLIQTSVNALHMQEQEPVYCIVSILFSPHFVLINMADGAVSMYEVLDVIPLYDVMKYVAWRVLFPAPGNIWSRALVCGRGSLFPSHAATRTF